MYCRDCWSEYWLNLQVDELRGEGHNIYSPQMQKQEVPNPAQQYLASSWHTGFLNSRALPYAMLFLKKFTFSRNTAAKQQWIKIGRKRGNGEKKPQNKQKSTKTKIPKFSQNNFLSIYSTVRKKGGEGESTNCDTEEVLL